MAKASGKAAYKDLRHWIAALETAGQLSRIKAEVDWNSSKLPRSFAGLGTPSVMRPRRSFSRTSRVTRHPGQTRSFPVLFAPGTEPP